MAKRHANEFLRTSTGRLAGSGMEYDDYSEEVRLSKKTKRERNPVYTEEYSEYIKELKNQPVTVYKLTKNEMEEYLKKFKGGEKMRSYRVEFSDGQDSYNKIVQAKNSTEAKIELRFQLLEKQDERAYWRMNAIYLGEAESRW